MIRFTKGKIIWAICMVVVGTALFHTSEQVQDAKSDLVQTQAQLEREKETLRVLKAEWSHLNNPEKLEQLSQKYLTDVEPAANHVLIPVSETPVEDNLQQTTAPMPRSKPSITYTEKPPQQPPSGNRGFSDMVRDLGVQ